MLSRSRSEYNKYNNSARLVLSLEEVEDGHDMFHCEPEETVASCGIWPNATLVIQIAASTSEDEDEQEMRDDLLEFD